MTTQSIADLALGLAFGWTVLVVLFALTMARSKAWDPRDPEPPGHHHDHDEHLAHAPAHAHGDGDHH